MCWNLTVPYVIHKDNPSTTLQGRRRGVSRDRWRWPLRTDLTSIRFFMPTRASAATLASAGAALVSVGLDAALASSGPALSRGLGAALAVGDADFAAGVSALTAGVAALAVGVAVLGVGTGLRASVAVGASLGAGVGAIHSTGVGISAGPSVGVSTVCGAQWASRGRENPQTTGRNRGVPDTHGNCSVFIWTWRDAQSTRAGPLFPTYCTRRTRRNWNSQEVSSRIPLSLLLSGACMKVSSSLVPENSRPPRVMASQGTHNPIQAATAKTQHKARSFILWNKYRHVLHI